MCTFQELMDASEDAKAVDKFLGHLNLDCHRHNKNIKSFLISSDTSFLTCNVQDIAKTVEQKYKYFDVNHRI